MGPSGRGRLIERIPLGYSVGPTTENKEFGTGGWPNNEDDRTESGGGCADDGLPPKIGRLIKSIKKH